MSNGQHIYVGTYTQPILFGTGEVLQGKGEGIYLLHFDANEGKLGDPVLISRQDNPSYLNFSPDKKFLYAVNELKRFEDSDCGAVSAFAVDKEQGDITFLNRQPTGGTDPCHVVASPDGRYVVVSNFMSGSVAAYPVDGDGSLQQMAQFIQHEGSSVDSTRQRGPHAHSATFDAKGSHVLVPDLGIDRLVIYQWDAQEGQMTAKQPYVAQPGAGPRYCEFHPSLPVCYLINELGSSISALSYADDGSMCCLQTVPTMVENPVEDNICADLHLTPDGRFMYGSNRGHDSIVVYAVDSEGLLTYVETVSSGGCVPRNFTIDATGGYLLVANQSSDNLVVFQIHAETGRLTKTQECYVPTPVCVKAVAF